MLPRFPRWHNAPNGSPEKEHRLCWYAFNDPPPAPEPNETPEEGTQESQPTAAGQSPVQGQQNTTRSQMQEAVQGSSESAAGNAGVQPETQAEQHLTCNVVLSDAEKMKKQLTKLEHLLHEVLEHYLDQIIPEDHEEVRNTLEFVENHLKQTKSHLVVLESLKPWQDGQLTPQQLQEVLSGDLHSDLDTKGLAEFIQSTSGNSFKNEEELLAATAQNRYPDISDPHKWRTYNESTRRVIIEKINDVIEMPFTLDAIHTHTKTLQDSMDIVGLTEMLEKIVKEGHEKEHGEDHDLDHEEDHAHAHPLFNWELYSVNEVWKACKNWGEAYAEAWHEKSHLKISKLAKKIGAVGTNIYLGKDAKKALDIHNDKANDEERDAFASFIKGYNYNYTQIFKPGGIFDQNVHEPNKARAVLDYAADKSWLTHIDEEWGKERTERSFRGHTMKHMFESIWPGEEGEERMNQYYKKLLSAQRSGESDAKESGKKQLEAQEDPVIFMEQISKELNSGNLWKAYGMMEVARDKGKTGEMSAWLATTLLSAMRTSENVRDSMPEALIGKFGKLFLGHCDPTFFQVSLMKKNLAKWCKVESDDEREEHFGELSDFAKVISIVEERIAKTGLKRTGEKSKENAKIDRLVARVLAGHNVSLAEDKRSPPFISIFENLEEFNTYRHDGLLYVNYDYDVDPKLTDPDYFQNPEGSGVIMVNQTSIGVVLDYDVHKNSFNHDNKARGLLKQVLNRYDELETLVQKGQEPRATLENFRVEMAYKLESAIENIIKNNNSIALNNDNVNTNAVTKNNSKGSESAIVGLFKRGILDVSMLYANVHRKGDLCKEILQNLGLPQSRSTRPPRNPPQQNQGAQTNQGSAA